jgi:hypothetical protein
MRGSCEEAGVSVDIEDVATDALVNAKLVQLMPPGLPVVFSFNPSKVTFTRQAMTRRTGNSSRSGGSPGGSSDSIWTRTEPRKLTFKAYLEGPQAHPMSSQLLEMMTPAGGLIGTLMALAGVNLAVRPPTLLFEWGPLTLLCTMSSCSVAYTRFHTSGLPLRAECDVTVTEAKSWFSMLLTNPTSGGVAGREQHVVVAGENLQHLATKSYGRPGLWRTIADANGIDDPFKVRPGDVLNLPPPSELAAARKDR